MAAASQPNILRVMGAGSTRLNGRPPPNWRGPAEHAQLGAGEWTAAVESA